MECYSSIILLNNNKQNNLQSETFSDPEWFLSYKLTAINSNLLLNLYGPLFNYLILLFILYIFHYFYVKLK